MRRIVPLALLVIAGCVQGSVTKEEEVVKMKPREPKPLEARKRLAVVDFEDKTEYGKGRLGTGAADVVTTQLVKCQQFRVVERQQVSKVLQEQQLGGSGVVDAATAARVGKILGVEFVVYGAITNFGIRPEGTNVLGVQKKRYIATSVVDVRLIHTETAEVLYAETGRGEARRESVKVLGQGGSIGYDETLAGDSLRAAIVKMMDDLIDQAP